MSLAELQRREAEMRTARAEMRETQNRLELLGVPRQEIERLDREHTIKADVPLRAPFDGRVIMRNITRDEVVETNQRLFTVADLSNVWVIASVPEKDMEYIQKDQTVEMVAAAYPHALFHGTITYISDVLDPVTQNAPRQNHGSEPREASKTRDVRAGPGLRCPQPSDADRPAVGDSERAGRQDRVRPAHPDRIRSPNRPARQRVWGVVAVIDGLQAGESVVTKGSFTLKSEMERHKIEPAS